MSIFAQQNTIKKSPALQDSFLRDLAAGIAAVVTTATAVIATPTATAEEDED